jgi:hypothetical protein
MISMVQDGRRKFYGSTARSAPGRIEARRAFDAGPDEPCT